MTKWEKALYRQTKNNAAKRGIDFALSLEDMAEMISRAGGYCEVTGLKFSLRRERRDGMRPYAPSVDRIDSDGGYAPQNCRLVCVSVNIAMNRWGDKMLRRIAHAVVSERRKTAAATYYNEEAVSRELEELLMTKRERARLTRASRIG